MPFVINGLRGVPPFALSRTDRLYIRASSKSIDDSESRVDISGCSRHLDALHSSAQALGDLPRDDDSLGRRGVLSVGAAQTIHHRVGHAHPGHLVGHELGVSHAVEREDPGDDRQPRGLDTLQDALEVRARRRSAASATNSAPASTL